MRGVPARKPGVSEVPLAESNGMVAFLRLVVPTQDVEAFIGRQSDDAHRFQELRNSPEHLDRIGEVWRSAVEVWKSNESALEFMFRGHPLLRGRRPVDIALESDDGARSVKEILGRLLYGSAA